MSEETKPELSDIDKSLLAEYRKVQHNMIRSIAKTEEALMVLQKTISLSLGSNQYWATEAIHHLKLGMLTLKAAIDVQPTVEILNELRNRKAASDADADAAALAAFKADTDVLDYSGEPGVKSTS